jgi:hypothetical protein
MACAVILPCLPTSFVLMMLLHLAGGSQSAHAQAGGTWALTGSMTTGRWAHTATLLPTEVTQPV